MKNDYYCTRAAMLGVLATVALLVIAGGLPAAEDCPNPTSDQDEVTLEEIRELHQEISLLNLLNGLYLSESQVNRLLVLAEEGAAVRRQQQRNVVGNQGELVPKLSALRDALYYPEGVAKEVSNAASHANAMVEKKAQAAMREELGRLEERTRMVLADSQIAIIEEFSPCLIPPKNLRDPVAVGQASTTDRELRALQVIRKMPESVYRERKTPVAQKVIARGEREKGVVPDDVRDGMVATYVAKMDSMREMSDVDFELHKEKLAKEFKLFDDDVTYRHGMRNTGKITRYFLNDLAVRVLTRWRAMHEYDHEQTELPVGLSSADHTSEHEKVEKVTKGMDPDLTNHYLGIAGRLVRERMQAGKVTNAGGRRYRKRLDRARTKTPQEQYTVALEIADKLNERMINGTSVDSMMVRVALLGQQKGLSDAARRGNDLTGTGALVQQAREDRKAGDFKAAYKKLTKAVAVLEAF